MPSITAHLTRGLPLFDLIVSVSAPAMRRMTESDQSPPEILHVKALIDTGASHSCVDPLTLKLLKLEPTGETQMFTAGAGRVPLTMKTFAVGVIVPNGKLQAMMIPQLRVTATHLFETQGFQVILGRDVLARCVVTYDGPAETITLAY